MKEILEKIKNEINAIKEEQKDLEKLTENTEKIKEEKKQLEEEQTTITDRESGFYKDLSEQIETKSNEFIEVNDKRMSKKSEIDKLIFVKKAEIKAELSAKKQYVDENRNTSLEGVDLVALKAEKEKLEKEIELNNTTKQQFEEMSDSEKMAVKKAKENYLNNKHKLDKINPVIELADTLDGKTPKDKFLEIENLEKMVEENFETKKLDNFLSDINLMESKINNDLVKNNVENIEQVEKLESEEKETLNDDLTQNDGEKLGQEVKNRIKKEVDEKIKMGLNQNSIPNQNQKQKTRSTQASSLYKIIIGNKTKILMGQYEFNVGAKVLKYGLNLSDKEISDILDKYINKEEEKNLAKQLIKENAMDTTVLNVICKSGIDMNAKKDMINSYLNKCLVPDEEKNVDIEYDKESLTKVSLIKRLLKKELNNEEKNQIITRAEVASDKGIATIAGEYKLTWKEKLISKITKNKPAALPSSAEKQKATAIQMIKGDMENGTNLRNRDLGKLNQYIVENENNNIERNAIEAMESNEKDTQDTLKEIEK